MPGMYMFTNSLINNNNLGAAAGFINFMSLFWVLWIYLMTNKDVLWSKRLPLNKLRNKRALIGWPIYISARGVYFDIFGGIKGENFKR